MGLAAAAGIGAVASIGGAALASSASKKASNKAADTAQQNNAANAALAREQYASNATRLDPIISSGQRAGGALNEMLLGPAPQPAPQAIPAQQTMQYGAPQLAPKATGYSSVLQKWAALQDNNLGTDSLNQLSATPTSTPTPATPALSAWDQFRNSTNYQFRLDEGAKGFTQGAFAKGYGESGAAMKGIEEYRQNFAANELGQYQQMLAQQQQFGFGAASALAGVGQNMTNNLIQGNNAASSAASNAALANGQSTANMYGSIAGALGQVAGTIGSSYNKTQAAQPAFVAPQFNGLTSGGFY